MSHPNKALREREQQLREDVTALLALPAFCRVVSEWLAGCGLWHTTFRGEATHAAAFAEGERNTGLRIMAELEAADPAALLQLKKHALPMPPSAPTADD